MKQDLCVAERKEFLKLWWRDLQKPEYSWWLKIIYVVDFVLTAGLVWLQLKKPGVRAGQTYKVRFGSDSD